MRVALLGYGAVAAVHARSVPVAVVYGPDKAKARRFAEAHGIARSTADLDAALAGADAAIIASPSPRHFEQAARALEAGLHTLVELPPCESAAQARELQELARGRVLQCAHTSRYLDPYRRLGAWLAEGELGEVEHIHYIRHIPPRRRSWTDHALLHHAAHPLDLFLHWFGGIEPAGRTGDSQNAAVLARLANGAPVAVDISYTALLPQLQMTVAGGRHTVLTDGFSYVRSDRTEFCSQADGEAVYHAAIRDQDAAFLAACRGASAGVPWEDTLRLAVLLDALGGNS